MVRKFLFLCGSALCCLLLWSGWAKAVQADDVTVFLPIVQDGSLRGEIVFYQYRTDTDAEIVKLHLPQGTLTQLTHNGYWDSDPTWSPDGTQIAYTSSPHGNTDLYLMDADGSNQTPLTATPENDAGAAWSPDGDRLVFTREVTNTETSLFLLTLSDLQVTRLTTSTGDFAPDWSPDGQKIAFISSQELMVMDLNTRQITQLTDNEYVDWSPDWSPDGTKLLAYAMGHNHSGETQLYWINADGSGQQFLPIPGRAPRWSPDGKEIVYEVSGKFFRELAAWRLDLDTEEWLTAPSTPMFENPMRNSPDWHAPTAVN